MDVRRARDAASSFKVVIPPVREHEHDTCLAHDACRHATSLSITHPVLTIMEA